jgi:hypothetical protein
MNIYSYDIPPEMSTRRLPLGPAGRVGSGPLLDLGGDLRYNSLSP